MKIPVHFTEKNELLIRGGYKAKYGRILDESIHTLRYDELTEYIKLGKQAKRRQSISDFFDDWGAAIVWVLIIGGFFGWQTYSNHQKELEKQERFNSSYQQFKNSEYSPSKSGIHQAEICPITTCNDGACSSSTGRGTCSHHGGVRHY